MKLSDNMLIFRQCFVSAEAGQHKSRVSNVLYTSNPYRIRTWTELSLPNSVCIWINLPGSAVICSTLCPIKDVQCIGLLVWCQPSQSSAPCKWDTVIKLLVWIIDCRIENRSANAQSKYKKKKSTAVVLTLYHRKFKVNKKLLWH